MTREWDIDLGDGLYIPTSGTVEPATTRWENAVEFRAFRPADFELVYSWATAPDVSHTWRYRGATPSPEMFAQQLWTGVLCQFIATIRGSEAPIGLATLYDANLSSQHAHMSCLVASRYRRTGAPIGMALALLTYAFDTWPLVKVYMETNSVSIRQYQSALNRRFFFEEARILGFERFGDGWADLIYLSIDRAGLAAAKSFFGGNS